MDQNGLWRCEDAAVVSQQKSGPDWYRLTLRAPAIAPLVQAGQFVQVRVHPDGWIGSDPLLRRPLSVCTVHQDELTLIYRVVGRGSFILSQRQAGEGINLLGPLGRPFPLTAAEQCPLFLVGGGLGIPPLALAAKQTPGRRRTAILGARSKSYLAGAEEVAATGIPVLVITEDGSSGSTGRVTDLLAKHLGPGDQVWACGPDAMLMAVSALCDRTQASCWLSIERPMACGFGVCIGCTVARQRGGFAKTCVDGPVFRSTEVNLLG